MAAAVALGALLPLKTAHADIVLNDPAKSDGWEVKTSGQVNAYANYIFGETINRNGLGNLINPGVDPTNRYILVGPQVSIQGNATPSGAADDPLKKDLGTFRVRGGFASTILNLMIGKQLFQDLKLDIKLGLWAGIDNYYVGGVRPKNDAAPVDWREQFADLSGSWGTFWGGRKLGLYNRGGMRMNWFLMHQHGIGHPCNVDSSGTAQCGHTGVGSMFPNRNAQLGYATPDFGGLQLSVAMLDGAGIALANDQWNRTPTPRFEAEATFKKVMGGSKDYPDEINAWANGLTQTVGRSRGIAPTPPLPPARVGHRGIAADKTLNVWGVGGGAWGRFSGFGIGGTGWYGAGLGTATPFGNTAVDDIGTLRKHFGYLAIANFRLENFEIAASYGSTNAQETNWDKHPDNTTKISVIKQVRGIGGKVAYHLKSVVFSIDGLRLDHTWWRGETQAANVVSAGFVAKW
ncbi:MAG TPA: hypothetical protein VJN18_27355 [Polyangiaceae bacterium]|nr:hypothetical protein [Polyangiaceae bacterium]